MVTYQCQECKTALPSDIIADFEDEGTLWFVCAECNTRMLLCYDEMQVVRCISHKNHIQYRNAKKEMMTRKQQGQSYDRVRLKDYQGIK